MRFLLVAALCGLALASLKPSDKQLVKDTKSDYSDEWDSAELERYDVHESIFRADREYRYRFDGQLSAGIPLDIADQHAITRVQALVTIQPKDGRTFYMQMERVRFGSSQQHEMEPRYLKPFDAFDNVDMDKEHERLLTLPLRFTYKNGMVSEIVFSENDQMWSENIKRAVLNMLQVDLLKQNKVEVERRHEVEKIGDKKEESWTGVERTLEGECQVTYIRMETEKGMQFSKSLNFTNCQERTESRQYMAMCEECETHNREEEKLSSSVMSMNLTGNHETYLINDVEIRSQHLFSKLNDKQKLLGSFVHNKLRLVYAGKKEKSIPEVRGEKKQTLLYNNQWEKMMEKFAQTGESKYLIKIVKNKVEHIVKLIDQMAGHLTKHIEQQAPHTLARTVKLLRICTEEELQQIDKHISEKLSQMEQKTAEKVRSIYFNALGLAGTRNTIKHIAEKINKGHMEPIKGAQVLKSLIEMRYPSPQIVDEIQRICESDAAYRSPVLRQSCWLTYGAVINGVCTESSRVIRANRDERLCTREMKKSYTSKILGQMQKASNRYEKVLFMKVLANAGLDTSIVELEKIIYDKSETKTIRLQAIEATRRLIPMMPRKIQRLLMPIYRNRFEKTELRLSALHHLMLTEPDVTILSQIAEQFEQERSQQVRAFTFTCLKSWAESTNPCKESFSQSVARIVKRLEKTTVRPLDSRFAKWDMYSREYEAGWSASWASLFTNDSVLPNDVLASLDGLFGGHFSKNFLQVGFSQHNMDTLLAKLFNKIEETGLDEIIVRGKRAASESSFRPMEMLSNLYDRLRISRRGANPSAAHGLLYIRHRDVDYAVVPFEQETLPEFIRNMFHNGRIEIAELERWLAQGGHFTWSSAAYVYESTRRVPTALGIPVEMSIKMPTVATVSGNVRMEVEPKNGEKFDGLRFKVIARPSLATTHVNKIETFCPVVSIGVKILSNANLNTPINTEILVNWHKKLTLKTMTKLPEQKEHIGHFSTRPVTFIRHMRPEMRQYPEPIEKTIVISEYQLPSHEVNREYFKMTGFSMQVQGTLRSPLFPTEVSVPKSVLIADNHLDIVVVPTSSAPKELNTITEIELFVPADKFEQPRFEKYFEKTSRKQNEDLFETEDGDYLEEDEPTRRRAFDSYLKTFKTGKAYKHRIFVRAETERKEQFAEFEMIAQCDKEMMYCNAKVEAKRSPLMNDERRDWRMSGKVELLYPQTPKSLREMKEQQHRELQINGRFEWEGEQKQQWMNIRIQGEQSREQKAWMKAVETKMTRLSEIERLEEASRLNQYKMIVDYEMARETRYTWDKLFTLVKGFQWYYPLSSGYQLVDNQQGRVEARLTIEPRSRRFANLTVETPRERLSLSNLRMPFQLPTTKIYQSRSERSTLESRSSANRFFDRIVKQAECVVKSNKINTFDDVSYSAPITTCYSVLAKDCGSEKPAFAILMKKLTKTGGEKKLKIVTKKAVITAELELDNKEQMKITIDGKHIVKPEELEKYDIVREDSDVIRINNEHFMVVFDGYEVRIRINEIYRNRQCGICGHYDGETESEFRRADNYEYEENDLPKFMRSYLSEDEECQKDDETLNDLKKYGRMERRRSQSSWSDKREVDSSEEEYEPYKAQSNEWDDESDEEYNDEEKPEKRTRVIERSNKICFSVEPVEECDDKSEEREMQKREVEFVCARRDNSQVRELMRLAKRRVVSQQQLEKLEDSQTQRIEIRYPTKCYAGRQ